MPVAHTVSIAAVGRDVLVELLQALGAEVLAFGRSATFVPVDTEAVRPEDVALARQWSIANVLHAIVSTNGDSDRPLVADEHGEWTFDNHDIVHLRPSGNAPELRCYTEAASAQRAAEVNANALHVLAGWRQA